MTRSSLKSYLESLETDEKDTAIKTEEKVSEASRIEKLKQLIRDNPDELDGYAARLRNSLFLRNITPLVIDDLAIALRICDKRNIGLVSDLLMSLPQYLRPMETYTFCMESWVNLHQERCSHGEREQLCRLAIARSVLASAITDLITRTEKGPLSRNRMDYLMSFGLQLLSKYFNAPPIHAADSLSNDRMTESVLKIAEGVVETSGSPKMDVGNSIESDVCVKLLASLVQFRYGANLNHNCLDILELLRRVDSSVFNSITTRVQIFSSSCVIEETGGYEVSDYDIASLAVCVPGIFPLVWSQEQRSLYTLEACNILMQSREHLVNVAINKGLVGLTECAGDVSPSVSKFMRLSIETATSVGDEDLLSLPQRQSVFKTISDFLLSRTEPAHAIHVCLEIVRGTRIDACAGIFIKIAKDMEQKTGCRTDGTKFFEFAQSVFGEENDDGIDVINATDSLKSVLNWARWMYLMKTLKRDKKKDEWFKKKLDQLITFLQIQNPIESEQQTRILFIGHLVARVKELMSG